jgi:hypothetical protein
VQARLHRAARHAQDAGRLGLVETVQVAEHEDGTLVGRETLEHPADVARELRVVAWARKYRVVGQRRRRAGRGARGAHGLPNGDGPHPGVEGIWVPSTTAGVGTR